MENGVAIGNAIGCWDEGVGVASVAVFCVGVGVASVAVLTRADTAVPMVGVDTGVWACVVIGVGVAAEVRRAVAVGSKGISVGGVDLVHATRDTSITRANLIKRFLFQAIHRFPCIAGEFGIQTRPLLRP